MPHEFKTTRRVEFAETDMAGILHFSNYYRYMEATEHAFFRSLGLRVHTGEGAAWGAARKHAECTFSGPLRYEDEVELHLLVREKRTRAITYEVIFRKLESGAPGPEVARGRMTVVFIGPPNPDGRLTAVPIPEAVTQQLEVAP